MTTQYTHIAELVIRHSYYNELDNIPIDFVPSATTAKLFQKYGFLMRPIFNGFQLFSTSDQPLKTYLQYIERATQTSQFSVSIAPSDDYFYNYTELLENGAKSILYSTSNTQLILDKKVLFPGISSEKTNAYLGEIQLNFEDLYSNEKSSYLIEFTAQKTQWNYFVINRSQVNLNNPFIKSKTELKFESPISTTLPTGEQALQFSSGKSLIPLHANAVHHFDLADTIAKPGTQDQTKIKTLFVGLPNPLPSRINFNDVEGEIRPTSPMYVYL